MRPELDIYGIYIPTLGVLALGAYVLNTIMQRLLARVRFYRFVWHRPLFDAAMYFCILGAAAIILNGID
ncbi:MULTISPECIES: DUF1656 domain-containing protein [Brucella/Ochrobactrum group]|jgi:hypothetical protein|uniref:DUF1656 domain-containing protein n=3 Tax=Brucella/Ochrobactrum group TaxID=2826938 RepID=A0ABD5JUI2_9HYPH|nr:MULTISPECIES: DUF1656 domain-containing protein [Brucella]KAB2700045.1 DUF1656 domain-containing protein [Ochrobactrum sp. Kaboul]MBA8820377.1 hypothetical protein [Ochrobactrum sp. P6BSIII]MBA8837592.1 hypothetical protein [Ochrobactrum sp. RH2CCR150]MCI1000160.1 DUF1656 domain-containing protein [Ochrobactrum sp. C6C9]MDH7788366.1 hypothetical protein [Ochrobactrum sp. 19YEA23]OOL16879.1 hypothetical protein BRY73_11995 [Ochrobactrum sp. P6BS-III]RRD23997.1 DUF1656 domain-containing pro